MTHRPNIGTLHWSVAAYCGLLGALMLVAPHQFENPSFAVLQPHLPLWGVVFLFAGLSLIAAIVFIHQPVFALFSHLLAGAALLLLALGFGATGAWTGTSNYTVLGIGTALAPFLAVTESEQPRGRDRDLFALLIGIGAVVTGSFILVLPGQFSGSFYDVARPYLLLHGIAFLGGGGVLLVSQLHPAPSRPLIWLAHLLAGGAFLAFVVTVALPIRSWTAIALYGGFGTITALLPWLEPRLRRVDRASLRVRLALALIAATALPLIIAVTLVIDQGESFVAAQLAVREQAFAEAAGVSPSSLAPDTRSARDLAFGILLVVIGVAGTVGAVVAGRLTAPLTMLSRAVEEFAAGNSLAPLPRSHVSEVERLGAVIGRLREHLAMRTAESEQAQNALRESADALRFLADASRVLASSLDWETTLASVARLAVPTLADHCLIDVVEEDGQIRRVELAYADPAKEAKARELLLRYPLDPKDVENPLAETLRTGQTMLVQEVSDLWLQSVARSAEHLEFLREVKPQSVLLVPLLARGRTLGLIVLAMADTRRHFGPADRELAEELARRAALAVDNARLYGDAQRAISARDEFISVAAHELRTPITSLRGFSQLTVRRLDRQEELDPAEIRRALDVIEQQSERLSVLVSQLLDVSRIAAGQVAIHRVVTDLAGLVASVTKSARASFPSYGIVVHTPEKLPALVDPVRIEQLLLNLIDNAIKFSPSGSRIDVELAADGDPDLIGVRYRMPSNTDTQQSERAFAAGAQPLPRGARTRTGRRSAAVMREEASASTLPASAKGDTGVVRISVTDHGSDFPREYRQRIFDRSYFAHPSDRFAGMGLGLYVGQQIADLHGGRLAAEFPPEGGMRLVVTLPSGLETPAAAVGRHYPTGPRRSTGSGRAV